MELSPHSIVIWNKDAFKILIPSSANLKPKALGRLAKVVNLSTMACADLPGIANLYQFNLRIRIIKTKNKQGFPLIKKEKPSKEQISYGEA